MTMKSGPTARRMPVDNLRREAHSLREVTAPLVLPLIGTRDQELVDQVTLGAHDLNAVVARLRASSAERTKAAICRLTAARAQGRRLERRDRRSNRGRRDRQRVVGIAPRMQYLHADAPARRMHRVCHESMAVHFMIRAQLP